MKESILLIEDEVELQQNLKEILEYNGFSTLTADNGQEGLLKLDKHRVDLIICDIMMPLMNGFQFLRSIRSQSRFKYIPFIFLSAKASKEDKSKGFSEGANDYLVKPISSRTLLKAIDGILSKKNKTEFFGTTIPETQNGIDFHLGGTEVKSPLSGMIEMIETFEHAPEVTNLKENSRFLQSMMESAKRLHQSFGKLPLLKNLDKLNSQAVPVNVDSVILELINNYGAEKFIYLNRPKQHQLFDLEHFQFILTELIGNAIKFNFNNHPIQIDWLGNLISIRNKQAIFAPSETISIEPFDLRKNDKSGINGLGIGLYLAFELCKMNHCTLNCAIDPDQNFVSEIVFLSR
jgi:DNA-binding response OmpR family regulator